MYDCHVVMMLAFVGLTMYMIFLVMHSEARGNLNHQYCVIGAGPSGKLFQLNSFKCHIARSADGIFPT